MTPRTQLEWIDVAEPADVVRRQIAAQPRSRYLVCETTIENVLGIVYAEDLLAQSLTGQAFDVRAILSRPLYVPASMPALDLLEELKKSRQQAAVVLDEFGGLQGLATAEDLAAAVVGDIDVTGEHRPPAMIRQGEATWLMRGTVSIEDVEAALDVPDIPEHVRHGVRTLGGFIMTLLGRVPKQGDIATWGPLRLEVMAMDGRRVERVVVAKVRQHGVVEIGEKDHAAGDG
jgi:putative hemolysin